MTMNIPYAKHDMTQGDIDAVVGALNSGSLTGGLEVECFENDFAHAVNAPHAVAMSCGTAALHLAVRALGLNEGETVIVPSLTFAATANVVRYCGAQVEFVDIDPNTLNLDLDQVSEKLKQNPGIIAGIIAVDFGGFPLDVKNLSEVCRPYDTWIVQDSSHALGAVAVYGAEEVTVGSSTYVDATTFSFHPAKHITSGEGGMVTTSDGSICEKIKLMRSHCMDKTSPITTAEPWRYVINDSGYNYRLSDINAALGRSQLHRLGQNLARREEIATRYREAFKGSGVELVNYPSSGKHANHLFIIMTENRKELYMELRNRGVHTQVHYYPLHMQPAYRTSTSLPATERYYERALSIPMFHGLSHEEQEYVIESIFEILRNEKRE